MIPVARLSIALLPCLLATFVLCSAVRAEKLSFQEAQELLEAHCHSCHSGDEPEGGLSLVRFDSEESIGEDAETWNHVIARLEAGEMPPEGETPLLIEDREQLVDWIKSTLRTAACDGKAQPGPAPLRRLNRTEYSITIRDLLGIHVDAGHGLPADGAGGAGFDNAAETLFLSPVHAEKYLEAAKEALDYAAKDSAARELLLIATPDDDTSPECAARTVLKRFATRAYRRPVDETELDRLLQLFKQARERGEPFESAIFYSMQAVLISPHFLFLVEQPAEGSEPQPLSDYELASRLSYFLWSSMPDDELFELAERGKLHDCDVLRKQVVRMLKDEKSRGIAEHFVGQWLGTRALGSEHKPDGALFPRYDHELETSLREEPIMVFQEILSENRSLLELLDADYTYVNRDLARHYRIEDHAEQNAKIDLNQQLQRVPLPEDDPRGGVITMAGVLTVSSYPERTSPVLRGKWVLESLLGSPPPPPPPDAGELSEEEEDVAGKTLRERLEIHRRSEQCASCHERMDPIGFGLENFDAIGRWRTEEAGKEIDASGELPGGVSFSGPRELKQVLLNRKDDFVRHLATRMLSYALGRGLVNQDYCTIDKAVDSLQKNEYRAQELVWEIVWSVPFRYRGGIVER